MPLYETDDGVAVVTHSMLKTFRRCAKQAEYKYHRRLKPRVLGKPLKRGTWVHQLLDVHYKGGDWKAEHQRLSTQFAELFDEEKDFYGDLPREINHLMTSYFWHYAKHDWKVLESEFVLETPFPDGTMFRCKIDLLIEDQFGLWVVDHKSHQSLPNLDYRILDAQSADYIWCALRNKIPVQGHIWNYIKWKTPTVPQLVYQNTPNPRLSTKKIETDYPTYARALKRYGIDTTPYQTQLKHLYHQRYVFGEMQTSPFFRRSILEKNNGMLKRVASEAYHTAQRINSYPFDRTNLVERSVDRSCTFSCSYHDICALELFDGDAKGVMKNYITEDPLVYYNDDDSNIEKRGDTE